MYRKEDASLNFVKREEEIVAFWKDNNIFEQSLSKTKNAKEFSFYDGPPTANGKPHIGHVLTRVIKDILPRYKTMQGFHVTRKAGWDTHGLPVELEVEKSLGLDGKGQIESYGIEPFIKKCKESVFKYVTDWEDISNRIGYWVDMDNPYITYTDDYIESVWWSIKQIFDKDLIYKGHKIVPYCPRCGTALSSHEVAQGYKDIKETTAVVKFKVSGILPSFAKKLSWINQFLNPNTFILAWTTTPWTLPSNVALCTNPDFDYSLIECEGERFILANQLISSHFEENTYKVLVTKKGSQWEGLQYSPLFPLDYTVFKSTNNQNIYSITCDNYVTLDSGTGVVHIAPAFGEDDSRVGKKYDLPFVQVVDTAGKFRPPFDDKYSGVFVKDADKQLIKDLKQQSLIKSLPEVTHSYPFCWRCDTPLIYYARPTWFIKMTAVKDKLIKNNAKVNWIPESIGSGRMGNFLENVVDWGLSRERYWGTPLPIWVCECGHIQAIGSKQELKTKGNLKTDIELHKPYVDKVQIDCDKCLKKMNRTPEVIDCWYDSGSMPFAQHHYPFKNHDIFEKTFPADFISEAVDQTRGWFYTLLAISTLLFDKPPFKNCIVLGHVADKNGLKMSKTRGNVVNPWDILNVQGADAARWYFYTGSALHLSARFSSDAVKEGQRKVLGTLWNTYCFYVLYANIDKFDPTKHKLSKCRLTLMDKWLLSGLNTLAKNVSKNLDQYKIIEAAKQIGDFVDELSNWYVRRCRERFWSSGMDEDKIAAFSTLYHTLKTLVQILAPFTPFMSEAIYQNIVKSVDKSAPQSVHLCYFPKADESYIDKDLEKGMKTILEAAYLGRAARAGANIKTRQPLSKMLISGTKKVDTQLLDILEGEINVKSIKFIPDASEYVSYEVKPQLKTLGPKYGSKIGAIRQFLAQNGKAVLDGVGKGQFSTTIDGEEVIFSQDDILFSVINKEGFSAQSENGITVVLDIALTDELILEGYYREIVSKVQSMRKDSGFEVTDYISLSFNTQDTDLIKVFDKYNAQICADVFAKQAIKTDDQSPQAEQSINGKKVFLKVQKV